MDLWWLSFPVEGSDGDPNPQTKQVPHRRTQLQTHCTDQLSMQGPWTHD